MQLVNGMHFYSAFKHIHGTPKRYKLNSHLLMHKPCYQPGPAVLGSVLALQTQS